MRRSTTLLILGAVLILAFSPTESRAGGLLRRRDRSIVETVDVRPENRLVSSGMLGTFVSTPVITVRGNGPRGGGYTPLGQYGGNNTMVLYGPISDLRATTAPITTVVRGYDGGPVLVEGTSFSTPFNPSLSPVQYPTRASNYSAVRDPSSLRRSGSGIMWVDQQ